MQKVKWMIFFLCATFSINYPCHQLSSAANYCSTWGGGWKILSQLMWPNIFRQNSPIITPTSKNPIYLWLQTIHDARSIFHQVLNSTSAEIRNVSVFTFQEIKGCGATWLDHKLQGKSDTVFKSDRTRRVGQRHPKCNSRKLFLQKKILPRTCQLIRFGCAKI